MTGETWLRVVLYRPDDPEDLESIERIKSSTQSTLRTFEKLDGFQVGYWGHNPRTGTFAAVTYWRSQEAIDAASEVLEGLHAERKASGVSVVSVENIQLFTVPTAVTSWLNEDDEPAESGEGRRHRFRRSR
jgi:hypothetical protein